jgi:poly(3-hydroxybutyrate) depolymerase
MRKLLVICLAAAVVLAAATALEADKKKYKKVSPGTFTLKSKSGIDYVLSVPKSYNPETGAPFMLCIHGDAQFPGGMPDFQNVWSKLVTEASGKGFVVCAPKASGMNWAGKTKDLMGLIGELEEKFNLRIREYIAVGHSSGGGVAYQIALEDTTRFSAFGSLAGRFQVNQEQVKKAGIFGAYVFQLSGDTTVTPAQGKAVADSLKAAGATVEYKEANGPGHAMDYYIPAASPLIVPWFLQWIEKKARALADPGDDTNIAWESTVGYYEKLKEQKKAGLVFVYSKEKDKENKTAMWLRWEVFPDEDFKKLSGEFVCMKVDYTNDAYKDAVKDLKVRSCGLLVVDGSKNADKKWTKPVSLDKLLKDLAKSKEKVEKSYK